MSTLYSPDKKMTDILDQGRFTLSAEIIPPRNGSPQVEILDQIRRLTDAGAEFLSVTKGAGGSLRGGSLPIAQVIKEKFEVPAIAHFTCRDLSPAEVENQLMDHHYFGIRNILALRGDPPLGQPDWKSNALSYPYAYQLIEQIQKLNHGQLLQRQDFANTQSFATDFCIGAAAYPEDPDRENRIGFFEKKVKCGAQYGITQMIYDIDAYRRFVEDLGKRQCSVPILPGFRILKTQEQARKMQSRFQIKIPDKLLSRLPENEVPLSSVGSSPASLSQSSSLSGSPQVLDLFSELALNFKDAGAPGLHLFVLSDTEACTNLIHRLAK